MKIVVLDGYTLNPGDLSWKGLEGLGSLICYDRTDENEIVDRIGDAEAVIVNKIHMSRETLKACPNIKYIGVLATGYNVIDVEAAKELSIVVTNIPTYGTTAVSQFAIALLLEICHHVGHHSNSVKEGNWSSSKYWCYWDYPLMELSGKTMGVIGFGKIGQNTAAIALALGMNILAFDEYPNKELENDSLKYVSLNELLSNSDVISLHCPLFPSTEGIINKDNISKMKNGVFIINTSRGALVVEDDVFNGLESGKIGYYAADVASSEPIESYNVLLKSNNCIITPHIAWAPKESRARLMDIAVDNLKMFIQGNEVNVVNK